MARLGGHRGTGTDGTIRGVVSVADHLNLRPTSGDSEPVGGGPTSGSSAGATPWVDAVPFMTGEQLPEVDLATVARPAGPRFLDPSVARESGPADSATFADPLADAPWAVRGAAVGGVGSSAWPTVRRVVDPYAAPDSAPTPAATGQPTALDGTATTRASQRAARNALPALLVGGLVLLLALGVGWWQLAGRTATKDPAWNVVAAPAPRTPTPTVPGSVSETSTTGGTAADPATGAIAPPVTDLPVPASADASPSSTSATTSRSSTSTTTSRTSTTSLKPGSTTSTTPPVTTTTPPKPTTTSSTTTKTTTTTTTTTSTTSSMRVGVWKSGSAMGMPGCTASACAWVGVTLTGFTSSASCTFSDAYTGVWYTQVLAANFSGRTQAYYGWPGRLVTVICNGVAGSIVW